MDGHSAAQANTIMRWWWICTRIARCMAHHCWLVRSGNFVLCMLRCRCNTGPFWAMFSSLGWWASRMAVAALLAGHGPIHIMPIVDSIVYEYGTLYFVIHSAIIARHPNFYCGCPFWVCVGAEEEEEEGGVGDYTTWPHGFIFIPLVGISELFMMDYREFNDQH